MTFDTSIGFNPEYTLGSRTAEITSLVLNPYGYGVSFDHIDRDVSDFHVLANVPRINLFVGVIEE